MGSWSTCCTLVVGVQENFKQCLSAFFHLTCIFVPWLFDSLDLPRQASESKKRWTPRLVSKADYDVDQFSVVRFVIKKLFVYLFMAEQCIHLVIQMYFMQICFHILWSGIKFTDSFVFLRRSLLKMKKESTKRYKQPKKIINNF